MSVLLKNPVFEGISQKELAQQIESKKKCLKKLPIWYNSLNIYYPKKVQIEQTSSEVTASYKASLVSGKLLIDLSGGFGVDSLFFSEKMKQVIHCEIDEELSQIACHNLDQLKATNITFVNEDAMIYLSKSLEEYDWIYADPARRHDTKGKVFMLGDCLPNITENLSLLFSKTDNILIKTAPLLDISAGMVELNYTKEVHVIAVENEVKELLWILEKGFEGEILIKTINYRKGSQEIFQFNLSEEKIQQVQFSEPKTYLYEPNVAILKSGGFKTIAVKFQLKKLAEHTHLYTSDTLFEFPGRRFKIDELLPYSKKSIRSLGLKKANITSRNFPERVAAIRKKFKLKDGGDTYLFFTKDLNNKLMVLKCQKA